MDNNNHVILFDGVCNLCNSSVDFLLKRDNRKNFRFVAIQSEAGQKLLEKFLVSPEIDSVILIKADKVFVEADAVIEIARLLPFPWKIFTLFRIFPKNIRNRIYRLIAANRYRWFGKREYCRMPDDRGMELNNK